MIRAFISSSTSPPCWRRPLAASPTTASTTTAVAVAAGRGAPAVGHAGPDHPDLDRRPGPVAGRHLADRRHGRHGRSPRSPRRPTGPKFVEAARDVRAASTDRGDRPRRRPATTPPSSRASSRRPTTCTGSATASTGASGSASRPRRDGPEPFSFIYFGDAQNDVKAHWSRVIRQAYRRRPAGQVPAARRRPDQPRRRRRRVGRLVPRRRLGQRDDALDRHPRQPRVRPEPGRRPGPLGALAAPVRLPDERPRGARGDGLLTSTSRASGSSP